MTALSVFWFLSFLRHLNFVIRISAEIPQAVLHSELRISLPVHTTITISDGDRFVDYTLEIECDFRAGSPPRVGWRNGGEPGEAPAVEINTVRCLELAVWCGKQAISAFPASDEQRSLERQIGEWCLEKYMLEIEQAVLEQCVERSARREF
jgi:hypothetical protein